jgi:hypothetical protein
MFARAPLVMRPGFLSVPVIVPEDVAARLNLIECEDRRTQRIYGEHVVGAVEMRGWRWVAAQVFPRSDGMGVFPWESVAATGRALHA